MIESTMSLKDAWPLEVRKRLTSIKKLRKSDRLLEVRELGESGSLIDSVLLLQLLDDPSWEVREEAVDALWSIGGALGRIGARAALGDPEWCVRSRGAEALEEIGTQLDVPRLLHALHDPEWVVRASAASSLGGLGNKRARKGLLAALGDPHPGVRRYAASALSRLQDPSIVPLLEEALARERENEARVGLLWALYRLGQGQRLDSVLALLQDTNYLVRCQVLDGLGMGVRGEDRAKVRSALRSLLDAEAHAAVRDDAERALNDLHAGGEGVTAPLPG